jgi:ribosomal protein S12 methylthiotransferase accessory factor YcaO
MLSLPSEVRIGVRDDAALYDYGGGYAVLPGPTAAAIVRILLDGPAPRDHVLATAGADAAATLRTLLRRGLVLSGPPAAPTPSSPEAHPALPPGATIAVRSLGPPVAPFVDGLEQGGATATEAVTDADALVVLGDDLLDARSAPTEGLGDERSMPWVVLALVPQGAEAATSTGGPLEPCWACLTARLRYNRPSEALARFAAPALPASARTAVRLLLDELNWALGAGASGTRVSRLRPGSDAPTRHPVERLPTCPRCGNPTPGGFPLAPSSLDIPGPIDVLEDPITGLVRSPRRVGDARSVAVAAIRYRSPQEAHSLDALREIDGQVAGGRGATDADAQRSARLEAAERISGYWHTARPHRTATAAELGPEALLPSELDLHSAAQVASRDPSNATSSPVLVIPAPLPAHEPTEWVRTWRLRDGAPDRWVPAAAAFYGYARPFAAATSNGCAAGATYAGAALRGLLELVERDAVAVWWYNRLRRPGLDPAAVGGLVAEAADELAAGRRTLDLLWLTNDLGIPVVAAVSRERLGPPGWSLGFGAGLSATEAAARATSELFQLLPHRPNPLPWGGTAAPADHPYLVPTNRAVPPDGPALGPTAGAEAEVLADVVAHVERRGITPLVVDQTHPLVGVPVVRVLAPGLVHFWRRLGAPRLYDVPVSLGWRATPLAEADANPLDLPI